MLTCGVVTLMPICESNHVCSRCKQELIDMERSDTQEKSCHSERHKDAFDNFSPGLMTKTTAIQLKAAKHGRRENRRYRT
jgi:hypothetical protein